MSRAGIEAATDGDAMPLRPSAEAPGEEKKGSKEKRFIFEKWCKGCAICVEFCPKKVLEMTSDMVPVASHPELCVYCGLCELRCPDLAISVHDVHRVAAEGDE